MTEKSFFVTICERREEQKTQKECETQTSTMKNDLEVAKTSQHEQFLKDQEKEEQVKMIVVR